MSIDIGGLVVTHNLATFFWHLSQQFDEISTSLA